MPRLLIALVLLAEINLRCVHTNACEDDDEQRCASDMEETGEETEGETDDPPLDLGG